MSKQSRGSLLGIVSGLMVSDNMGDVHDELDLLCDAIGVPRRQGNFLDGWTDEDWESIGKSGE